MFCLRFFLCWISSDLKNKNNYARRRQEQMELYAMENGMYDDTDGKLEFLIPKKSIISQTMEYWAYLENFILIVVLIMKTTMKKTGYYDNFLYGFCKGSECENNGIINKIIVFKLVVAILMLVGIKTVRILENSISMDPDLDFLIFAFFYLNFFRD